MKKLNSTTRNQLRFIQKSNKNEHVYIKTTVVLMLDDGYTPAKIAKSLGIDASSVYRYKTAFKKSDLDSYLATNYFTYQGKLSAEQITKL